METSDSDQSRTLVGELTNRHTADGRVKQRIRLAPWYWAVLALGLAACGTDHARVAQTTDAHEVDANDNRRAAGTWRDGALSLGLVIGEGTWHPEKAFEYRIVAFGEQGYPLVTPGPLIRVREGKHVDVTITNSLARDVDVHGLFDHSAEPPAPLHVPAHGTAAVRFRSGPAGTYYYWGTTGGGILDRRPADGHMTGALIVDGPGDVPPDRVFVIGEHANDKDPPALYAWTINGRSWPDTERLTYTVGEPVRWRWINATGSRHPLHLHGTYFRVEASGDGIRDQPVAPERRQLVSTEVVQRGATIALSWSPEKPGTWLFHCHILDHVMPENRLPLPQWYDDYAKLPHDRHMTGLVLGITALPAAMPAARTPERAPRRLTLHVAERPGVRYESAGLRAPGLGYALDGGPVTVPGPALVLERGAPVEITIVNEIHHATTVHWHGIQLESYYDGVAHFGGNGRDHTPYLMPGDTFVAKFTPPRAGTFIYHTHFNDYAQLCTGLYGALIVVEPGKPRDPATDHVFVISRDGPDEDKDPVLVNGAVEPPPVVLRAGVRHRLRVIGITPEATARVRVLRDGHPITWRAVAKDGADLPPALATSRIAEFSISPGETYDFEIAETRPGELRLEADLDTHQRVPRAIARLTIVAR